ncbi:MAG: DUF1972 domain-containing protein [Culturomica sp.]|jgi:glycosyltransferase involved in cell wall biosynthesis|nr:DUF1972 domain-containing protein [Culturomica sp.]
MKIAIISTRGIPNNYGGFEQFAEYLSVGLVKRGHEVTVYSPHFHPYRKDDYKGVSIKYIYSPEHWMGASTGSFVYDFLSLRDALKKEQFDILYVTGYTSIVPAYLWFDVAKVSYPLVVTNMDGLEFKRAKFNRYVRRFLEWEERMTLRHSHFLISDNEGIQSYYKEKYDLDSRYLAYGATVYDDYDVAILKEFSIDPNDYLLLIARMEPENNIEASIDGYLHSEQQTKRPLIVVGKTNTSYGKYLTNKYEDNPNVRFVGGIYDFRKINSLRHFSSAYFHGHSVGGTNPSLLEAMAAGCFILAHDNCFNATVLKENAFYWSNVTDITSLLNRLDTLLNESKDKFVTGNVEEIRCNYSWEKLIDSYEKYFQEILKLS